MTSKLKYETLKTSASNLSKFLLVNFKKGRTFENQFEFETLANDYAHNFYDAQKGGLSSIEIKKALDEVNKVLQNKDVSIFFLELKEWFKNRTKKEVFIN